MTDTQGLIPPPYALASYRVHKRELDAAISRVLERGQYGQGEETAAFEGEFSRYCESSLGVGVGSGFQALHLALRVCGVGMGDEVITVSQGSIVTVAAIELCGASPVLVDIEPQAFTLDPRQIKLAVTSKTKAVVPVHLFGHPADMGPIMEVSNRHGLYVVEDCSQSPGASYQGHKVGSFGHIGVFSFHLTKGLSALGNGGMTVTDDVGLGERIRQLARLESFAHGVGKVPERNMGLDELQAAVLRVKLRHLDEENLQRRRLAALYNSLLFETELVPPREKEDVMHVYHKYVVRSQRRASLRAYLAGQGLTTLTSSLLPVHLHPKYCGRVRYVELKNTEHASAELLSLPLHPHMSEAQVDWVSTLVSNWILKTRE